MKHLALLLTSACLLAPAAALAQKQEPACGKPFTAKAVGGGSDEIWDIACQGPLVSATRPGGRGVMLFDLRPRGRAIFLFPASREYYEVPPAQLEEQEHNPMEHLPCSKQRELAKEQPGAKVSCRKTGTAVVNGRKTDKYETTGEELEGPITEYWDPELQVIIKEQTGNRTTSELRDIKVGGVSVSVQPPAGWRKLTEEQYFAKVMAEAQQQEAAQKGGRRK